MLPTASRQLDRFGLDTTFPPGGVVVGSAGDALGGGGFTPAGGRRDARRSPVFDAVPELRRPRAWWTVIERPANLTSLGNANLPAVYVVERFNLPDVLGPNALDAKYAGCNFDLAPADVNGTGNGSIVAYVLAGGGSAHRWGSTRGTNAAMVVMVNSGLPERTWTQAYMPIPGIQDNAPHQLSTDEAEIGLLDAIYFPPGRWDQGAEAPAYRGDTNTRLAVVPLPRYGTIDVALVIPRAQGVLDSTTQHFLCGHCHITLNIAVSVPVIRE